MINLGRFYSGIRNEKNAASFTDQGWRHNLTKSSGRTTPGSIPIHNSVIFKQMSTPYQLSTLHNFRTKKHAAAAAFRTSITRGVWGRWIPLIVSSCNRLLLVPASLYVSFILVHGCLITKTEQPGYSIPIPFQAKGAQFQPHSIPRTIATTPYRFHFGVLKQAQLFRNLCNSGLAAPEPWCVQAVLPFFFISEKIIQLCNVSHIQRAYTTNI